MLETPEEKEFRMTAPVQSLTRALMFAAQKHTDQRRKTTADNLAPAIRRARKCRMLTRVASISA